MLRELRLSSAYFFTMSKSPQGSTSCVGQCGPNLFSGRNGAEPLKGGRSVLTILGMPTGWALIVLIIYAIICTRREIVRLTLGLVLIVRARRRDLPTIAKAVFDRSDCR
jgi:hypothetical protein